MAEIERTGRVHELKTWPEPFKAIWYRRKRFEIRRNDRGFAVGDELVLKEFDPARVQGFMTRESQGYTGKEIRALVTYLAPGGSWDLPPALCVMSIEPTEMSGVMGGK